MNHDHPQNGNWNRATKYVFVGFALIAGYFLITEHRAHVVQYLPFLLLLACPLMHLFHGHGGHGDASKDSGASKSSKDVDQHQHH